MGVQDAIVLLHYCYETNIISAMLFDISCQECGSKRFNFATYISYKIAKKAKPQKRIYLFIVCLESRDRQKRKTWILQ